MLKCGSDGKARSQVQMEHTDMTQLQHILERMNIGVVILDYPALSVLYANAYVHSITPDPWLAHGVVGLGIAEILPPDLYQMALPFLEQVWQTGKKLVFSDLPFEGFLEVRGRTYWRVSLELAPAADADQQPTLLVSIEDLTSSVRSSLQLEAIRHISAAIAGQSPLHDVLDRILLAMQELVGSKRCAVLLIDEDENEATARIYLESESATDPPPTLHAGIPIVRIVAQQGLDAGAADWHPQIDERLLINTVLRTRQALVVEDTSVMPQIDFPILNDNGRPRRPGSVVCVPILETLPEGVPGAILGTIEIYHRRPRGLPTEEVEMLEQFATQAGLAIQNARLFQRIKLLARVASQQAHQLENVMRAIPDGVIIYDVEWRLMEINHAARNLLGWSDADIGLHISQATARSKAHFRQNSPSIVETIASLEQGAETQNVDEFEMSGANNQLYSIRRSKAPIQDETGQVFAYVVVYHDVTAQATARKRVEREVRARTAELAQRNTDLQETQATLQLLLERLPAGVMLISLDNQQVTLINHQATQLLERLGVQHVNARQTPPDAVGLKIEDLLAPIVMYDADGASVPYQQQPLYRALYLHLASEAEFHTFQTDRQLLNLLVNAAPLLANTGTTASVVLVWQDITWLKALERAREDFFTTMAHELKTPLANIRAHLSALQARDMAWSPTEQEDFLHSADEQVERLTSMVNHFLDASRVEAGALRLDLEPLLLPEMFEDLQDRLEALISSSQRRLTIRQPAALPAVLGDYELIMGVLTNLLSNAFRYAPIGDTVWLEARIAHEQGQVKGVTLLVIDHGPGITPEQQAELFTRFSTFAAAHRTGARRPAQPIDNAVEQLARHGKRWSPATGLGLYISKGIVEAHGSTLEVQSRPGEGAIFAFTLSLASPAKEVG